MVLVGLKITLAFQKKNALTEVFVSMRSTNKIESIQKKLFDCYMFTILAPLIVFLQEQINHQ